MGYDDDVDGQENYEEVEDDMGRKEEAEGEPYRSRKRHSTPLSTQSTPSKKTKRMA